MKIILIDLDGPLCNFDKAFEEVRESTWISGQDKKVPEGFFKSLEPIDGAIDAVKELSRYHTLLILSTPQWSNPHSWKEKREWVGDHFKELFFKKMILSHDKTAVKGDYLIDDNIQKGLFIPSWNHLHFGSEKFPNWDSILKYKF